MKEHGISGFNVHRRRFGGIEKIQWMQKVAYTEMHRTRSSWEVSFLM